MTTEQFLEKANWTFARTLARTPHYWICRKDFVNDKLFMDAVNHIKTNGKVELFFNIPFTYFYLNDWKYWVMDNGLNDPTIIINRCKSNLKYDKNR